MAMGERAAAPLCSVSSEAFEDGRIFLHERRATATSPGGSEIEVSMPLAGLLLMVRVGRRNFTVDLEPIVLQVVEAAEATP
jgi:hypothetical protein